MIISQLTPFTRKPKMLSLFTLLPSCLALLVLWHITFFMCILASFCARIFQEKPKDVFAVPISPAGGMKIGNLPINDGIIPAGAMKIAKANQQQRPISSLPISTKIDQGNCVMVIVRVYNECRMHCRVSAKSGKSRISREKSGNLVKSQGISVKRQGISVKSDNLFLE